ncbi:MAG: OmpA family protein [Dysgonamonadaceae bacterium]|jgi:outer membrane protein OmpA-like peptidoglycan-associated protein|nr:OmpA family protein [Dysgonamonadaceae bacterium]
MKNLFLTAVFMLFALSVTAQKSATNASFVEKQYPGDEIAVRVTETAIAKNLDDRTSAVRTSWLANRPKDNWFISLEGGVSQLCSERYADYPFKDNLFPTGGLTFGKWFSPVWGLRISASGGKLKGYQPYATGMWYVGFYHHPAGSPTDYTSYIFNQPDWVRTHFLDEEGNNPFSYMNVTADFLVNLRNLFLPYNPKAFFNPVLYLGTGYVVTFGSRVDPFKTAKTNNVTPVDNLGAKGGIQLNFRLSDPVQLYVAGDALLVHESFDRYMGGAATYEGVLSMKLGLTYNFKFGNFIASEFRDPSEIAALNREINELRNRPQVVCPPAPVCPQCPEPAKAVEKTVLDDLDPVFFLIDSYVVRDNQMINVARAAEYLISHPEAKLELVSYADKQTANPPYNMQLSKKRTDAVAKVLAEKFGIKRSRLILSYKGDTVQPFAENDKNRVTMFIK